MPYCDHNLFFEVEGDTAECLRGVCPDIVGGSDDRCG
jgi:hypothetical protein